MSELAEGARLEIVCTAKSGTEGSNPSLSARKFNLVNVSEFVQHVVIIYLSVAVFCAIDLE